MMSKNEIKEAISDLESQRPKNIEEFDFRETEIKRLLDLFVSKVVF